MDTSSLAQGIDNVCDIHTMRLAPRALLHEQAFAKIIRDVTASFQVA